MERRTTVKVSEPLTKAGEPYLEWADAPTSSLSGYHLDLALLAVWAQAVGQTPIRHVMLIFDLNSTEVWADCGAGLKRWNPSLDRTTAQDILTAFSWKGSLDNLQSVFRTVVQSEAGPEVSVPNLRFK